MDVTAGDAAANAGTATEGVASIDLLPSRTREHRALRRTQYNRFSQRERESGSVLVRHTGSREVLTLSIER